MVLNQTPEIYLTGASGFIGQHISKAFEGRHRTIPIDRYALKSVNQLQFATGSTLIHAAARVHVMHEQGEKAQKAYRNINLEMTLELAKKALDCGVRQFIFISSLMVMTSNQHQFRPVEPYAESKRDAELGLKALFSNQSQTQCIVLRLPMVYGPGNKGNMLPLLKAASRHIPLPLASTKGKRSMIYVGNVSAAMEAIFLDNQKNHSPFQTFFISDQHDMTSGELYSLIFRQLNPNRGHGLFPVPEWLFRMGGYCGTWLENGFKRSIILNRQNISRLFDACSYSADDFCQAYHWNPPFTPDEGIKHTTKWWQEQHTSSQNIT
ncbi:MAG: NAD-dependent epimerase/dehydratase family protein [Mariprofundaceae bacterium]